MGFIHVHTMVHEHTCTHVYTHTSGVFRYHLSDLHIMEKITEVY